MKDLSFFESSVIKTVTERNEELGACWVWQKSCCGGRKEQNKRPCYTEEGKNKLAAREIYRLVKNPNIKDGIQYPVLHRCIKQPKCINPDHLYYLEKDGPKQNRKDAIEQGTIPLRKLFGKEQQIINLFKDGVEQQEIAKKIGVCSQTILRFLNGQYDAQPFNYVKEAEEARNKKIKELFDSGASLTRILTEAKTTTSVVFKIVPEIRNNPKGRESEESKIIKQTLSIEDRNKQIKELKSQGKSVREIACQFAISIPAIYTILKQI